MTEVSELVALLSKAERGYTKVLNRSFQNAGYDLSREQYELLEVLWERDHVNQQNISKPVSYTHLEGRCKNEVCLFFRGSVEKSERGA